MPALEVNRLIFLLWLCQYSGPRRETGRPRARPAVGSKAANGCLAPEFRHHHRGEFALCVQRARILNETQEAAKRRFHRRQDVGGQGR
jgi:hypothetical protein